MGIEKIYVYTYIHIVYTRYILYKVYPGDISGIYGEDFVYISGYIRVMKNQMANDVETTIGLGLGWFRIMENWTRNCKQPLSPDNKQSLW